jgi:hypothetical protein
MIELGDIYLYEDKDSGITDRLLYLGDSIYLTNMYDLRELTGKSEADEEGCHVRFGDKVYEKVGHKDLPDEVTDKAMECLGIAEDLESLREDLLPTERILTAPEEDGAKPELTAEQLSEYKAGKAEYAKLCEKMLNEREELWTMVDGWLKDTEHKAHLSFHSHGKQFVVKGK